MIRRRKELLARRKFIKKIRKRAQMYYSTGIRESQNLQEYI